ncbi:hypothetical protein ACGFXC_15290 [Streptomyces sp. NPDC048507]|uniref:hypothetical protein n=1 Tax=Streptomyces sp. NPDC048507 TaxID=3365560 RepID=UPI0037160017
MSERQPYEVTLVRAGPGAAAETTVLRLVGLLPPDWSCAQRVDGDRIRMLVHAGRDAAAEAVPGWLARTLADTAFRGWSPGGAGTG